MKKIIIGIMLILFAAIFPSSPVAKSSPKDLSSEIFYQIMIRSFYDSNGDGIGDINGLREKLGYLQDLGITAIWIMPVFASPAYFNYYADDFFTVDPELGTMEDFRGLCTDIHKRGMKILLDMETQYITKNHEWYRKAIANPESRYDTYIGWENRAARIPLSAFGGSAENCSYDGSRMGILTINLNNKEVIEYQKKIYSFWLDPNGDGNFFDGVDGYRMDHIMDDLDNKGIFTGLLARFWKPVIDYTNTIKPDIMYLVEPSDWGAPWDETLPESHMDAAFNIPLRFAIASMEINNIIEYGINGVRSGAKGKSSFTIIENHDVDRFASVVSSNPAALRLGAILNFTLPGTPCMYYGQELGALGKKIDGLDDGNDIPRREAFRWHKDWKKKGMAVWYTIQDNPDTDHIEGRFWADSSVKINDGKTLEEQANNPSSLFNFYKKIISIRKNTPALMFGTAEAFEADDDNTLFFTRKGDGICVIIANLSETQKSQTIDLAQAGVKPGSYTDLITGNKIDIKDCAHFTITLPGYGAIVLK